MDLTFLLGVATLLLDLRALLLDLTLSQTIPTLDRFPVSVQPRLDRNSWVGAALACSMACSRCLTGAGLKWRNAGAQLGVELGLGGTLQHFFWHIGFPASAPQQFPAFIWFHTVSCLVPQPLRNFLHASCFNI